METKTLVGIRNTSFKSQSGDEIEGKTLAFEYPIPEDKGEGFDVERIFVSNAKLNNLSSVLDINSSVQLVYNKYGKVDDIVDVK